MTIHSSQKSFYFHELPVSHSCSTLSSDSENCLKNSTTTDSSETISLLSVGLASEEEEDWQEFGYLLDKTDVDENHLFPPKSFAPPKSSKSGFSSMEAEVSSSLENNSEPFHEPVAKRTRQSLENRDKTTMKDGLEKLGNISKGAIIHNFLRSSPPNLASEKSDKENCFGAQALRKPKEMECDPRFITLGGSSIHNKEVALKTELSSSCDNSNILSAFGNHPNELSDHVLVKSEQLQESPQSEGRKSKRTLPKSDKTDDEDGGKRSSGKRVRINSNAEQSKPNFQSPARRSNSSKRQQKVIHDNDADEEDEPASRKRCFCGILCGPSESKKFFVTCAECQTNYHGKCVGLTEKKAQKLGKSWRCSECAKVSKNVEELYCVCRRPYDDTRFYVGCDSCEDWFHPQCIGTTQEEISQFDEFLCPKCRDSCSD